MLWLTVISVMALHVPGALGAVVPQISPSGDDVNSGKGPYAITYINERCSGTMILSHQGSREGDMNDEICISQPLGGSIKAVNDLQGGEYCLMKYGAFDCGSLEQTDYVKFKTGGSDECLSLSDRPYTSYRWKKAIDGKCETGPWQQEWD